MKALRLIYDGYLTLLLLSFSVRKIISGQHQLERWILESFVKNVVNNSSFRQANELLLFTQAA